MRDRAKAAEATREWQRRYPEKHAAKQREWYARHAEERRRVLRERYDPAQSRARDLVHRAIKQGELVRGPCEVGGDCLGAVQAHHDDYSRPLDVRWLCRSHHQRLHRSKRVVAP